MIGWLYRIIIGSFSSCSHEWETISQAPITHVRTQTLIGAVYVLKCGKCGDIQQRNIEV